MLNLKSGLLLKACAWSNVIKIFFVWRYPSIQALKYNYLIHNFSANLKTQGYHVYSEKILVLKSLLPAGKTDIFSDTYVYN